MSTLKKGDAPDLDGFPVRDHPFLEEHDLISRYLDENRGLYGPDLKYSETGRLLADTKGEATRRLVLALVERARHLATEWRRLKEESGTDPTRNLERRTELYGWFYTASCAVDQLLRRRLAFTADDLDVLLSWQAERDVLGWASPPPGVVKVCEDFVRREALTPEHERRLEEFIAYLGVDGRNRDAAKLRERAERLLGREPEVGIVPGEAWSDVALSDLGALDGSAGSSWTALIRHCRSASAGKPSKKWQEEAATLLEAVTPETFAEHVTHWFPLVDKPPTVERTREHEWAPDPNFLVNDINGDILKGLVWCCAVLGGENRAIARALTALALSAYRKVPGVGPRCVKVGNACVYALGQLPGLDAVGQLALLKVKVKFIPAQKGIEKALTAAAERAGVPREEIEEMGVPAYGLAEVGRRTEQFGEFQAELEVTGTTTTELRWKKPDGSRQKTVPAGVKKDFAGELKELKAAAKDIQKMMSAQRDRIDGLFREQKSWSFPIWKERYLDHPLVGSLARRIIWRFIDGTETAEGIFLEGDLVDADDRPIEWLSESTTVELWHPIGLATERVLAWRDWLDRHEVAQPFKQAHREVYLLTDAERTTRVYSNRYASHIIRQHQFNALCALRGWRNTLRLLVDDDFPPASRSLPKWNLRAEFWVEGAGEDYGTDTNDTGTFHYLATDQVRFYPIDAATRYAHAGGGGYYSPGPEGSDNPVPVADVPPLVFSEVMRDVDLFIGVGSVGNDPTWQDGGPAGRHRDYWASYSFGELAETARTRRAVLERLIPRLKIAKRCSFDDRFLVVEGDLRCYKIHLGSGNILMTPNDQYLCIVPGGGAVKGPAARVFLPFEGDRTLSIILSKAFLLAEDAKIKDPTISSQIRRK